jgi:hypothetical protein
LGTGGEAEGFAGIGGEAEEPVGEALGVEEFAGDFFIHAIAVGFQIGIAGISVVEGGEGAWEFIGEVGHAREFREDGWFAKRP